MNDSLRVLQDGSVSLHGRRYWSEFLEKLDGPVKKAVEFLPRNERLEPGVVGSCQYKHVAILPEVIRQLAGCSDAVRRSRDLRMSGAEDISHDWPAPLSVKRL